MKLTGIKNTKTVAMLVVLAASVSNPDCMAFNTYKNTQQLPYAWNLAAGSVTWTVQGDAPAIVHDSMAAAASAWSAATGGKLSMSEGGSGVTVIWDPAGTKLPDPLYLAYTTLKTDNATRITSATIVINAKNYTYHRGAPLGVGAEVNGLRDADLDGVIIHELGHALGLDHTDTMLASIVSLDPANPPTMYSTLHPGTETLHADDRSGIQSLYGSAPAAASSSYSSNDISASPSTGKAPLNTAFFQSTADENTQWNFGDGFTATGANPTHKFTAVGTYTVTATHGDRTSTLTVQVYKKAPKAPKVRKPKPVKAPKIPKN